MIKLTNKKGYEGEVKTIVIGFVLFALAGFLMLSVVATVGNDYGKDLNEVTGGSLNLNKFNETLSGNSSLGAFSDRTQTLLQNFEEQDPILATVSLVVGGSKAIFDIFLSLVDFILMPFSLISDIVTDKLGVPAIVVDTILGLLILVILLGLWRLVKIGE